MIEKTTLQLLVDNGLSTYQIAEELKCGQTNVRHYLNKYKLKTIRAISWNKDKHYYCKYCGETSQDKFYVRNKRKRISRYVCIICATKTQIERNRKTKLLAIEYKGGKCQKCGYKKCPAGLVFHHRNPEEKDLKWKSLKNCSFDKLKPELDKCDMVCQNCHAEIHWLLSGNDL
jgi:predicted transcriptional regulator